MLLTSYWFSYIFIFQSKPVEHAVESGEGPDENLEAGETRRNETEEIKQGEKVSEQEKGRDNSEKPEVTAATEEEKNKEKETVVVVEQGSSPVQDNENKTVSVLDTEEKTNLMADVEDVTVSVLGGIVSALWDTGNGVLGVLFRSMMSLPVS